MIDVDLLLFDWGGTGGGGSPPAAALRIPTGKFGVWDNGYIAINGVNLSDHCESFDFSQLRAALEFHTHGDDTAIKTPGIIDITVSARFFTDFASGSVIDTLRPLFDDGTVFPIILRPIATDVQQLNPQWSGNVFIQKLDPMKGRHGEVMMAEVVFAPASSFVWSIS